MGKTKIAFASIGVVIALALLGVGGWKLNWFVTKANVNQSAHIIRQSYEAQKTYRDEIQRNITDISTIGVQIADPANADMKQALVAQETAIVNQICQIATNLTTSDLSLSESQFITTNCPEGTLP